MSKYIILATGVVEVLSNRIHTFDSNATTDMYFIVDGINGIDGFVGCISDTSMDLDQLESIKGIKRVHKVIPL